MRNRRTLIALFLTAPLLTLGCLAWNQSATTNRHAGHSWRDGRQAQSPAELWDALTAPLIDSGPYRVLPIAQVAAAADPTHGGKEWPMFGGTPQRNMVNLFAKNVPTEWSVEEGKRENVKWVAELGNEVYGGPVVAGGKIYVGTTNNNPRDPAQKGQLAVLMCFNEADGKFLWQLTHGYPEDVVSKDAPAQGLCSTPTVEGDRLWYVTPGCEVVCASTAGKVIWSYDMHKELKVVPFHLASNSPLVYGDHVFVVTGNGTDEEGTVHHPDAPSFLALNKKSGKLAWKSNLPGKNIAEGQFSSPALAVIGGKAQVVFGGGDAWLYSFEPATGQLIWKCNCDPQRGKRTNRETPRYFVAAPVVHDQKIYVGLGASPGGAYPPRTSYVVCVDATRTGDVSPKTLNVKDAANKGSALVWAFGGPITPEPKRGRRAFFERTMSTCAVHDGLVYIPEETGYIDCLDAKTGQRSWMYDTKDAVWGSAYYVDGKVYCAGTSGEIFIFRAGKEMKLLNRVDMQEAVKSTPVVANGVLYITTRSKLYAIAAKK